MSLGAVDEQTRELMLGFCSLGDNCEFGIAQRHFGATPLDLLIWAGAPLDLVVRLLRARFSGFGDPKQLYIYEGAGRELIIRHTGYVFDWHGWVSSEEFTPEALLRRESARLPFLAEKIQEDLAEGRRIFVVKSKDKLTAAAASVLLDEMNAYGSPTLLFVNEGGGVSVERVSERLLEGVIPKFADPSDVPGTTCADDWLRLCILVREIL